MASTELKYFDHQGSTSTTYSGGSTGWSGGLYTPNSTSGQFGWITGSPGVATNIGLLQSTAGNGRIGNEIGVKSLQYRLSICPDVSVSETHRIRIIIFSDEECEGNFPTFGNIFGATETSGGVPNTMTIANGIFEAPLNPGYFGRYHIISDKTYNINNSALSSTGSDCLTMEGFHDLRDHRVQWDISGSSTISNALKGHIFMFAMYYNVTVSAGIATISTATPPWIGGWFRIRYKDS